MTPRDLVRFFKKVKFDLVKGCWLWTGALAGNGKYACFRMGGARHAHIISFNHWRGEVPKGKELDHIECDVRRCVNPWHVEPKTHKENSLRSSTAPPALNALKTHCMHGHPFTGDNLCLDPTTGHRYCRECRKQTMERWKLRQPKLVLLSAVAGCANPMTPQGPLFVGQRWRERIRTPERIVTVLGWTADKVLIQAKKRTWAAMDRFGRKHAGYELVP